MDHLNNKRQERWTQTVTNIDFTHSSRKAWKTISTLTGKNSIKKVCPLSPNLIAKQVVKNGKSINQDKPFSRKVSKSIKQLAQSESEENKYLGDPISLIELTDALKKLKTGKAPGPDGIHNEFLMHSGKKLLIWLTDFINVAFATRTIPKMWRRARVIAILKPGKDPNLP